MSDKLYELGKWSFTHRWRVISFWLVTIALLAVIGINYSKPLDTKISIPGTPAQAALDKLSSELPAASAGSGSIVIAAQEGSSLTSQKESVDQIAKEVAEVDGVASAASPFTTKTISQDGRIALLSVQLKDKSTDVSSSLKEKVSEIVADSRTSSLQVEMRGDILPAKETGPPIGEVAGIAVAAIVLAITFGGLIAAGMPLIIAFITVGLGMLSVQVASSFLTLPSTATALSTMLGLAVGIDYALFLIVKFIKFLKEGSTPQEAIGRTLATAGNAVIFAALTVIIALAALTVVGVPFLGAMGVFAAITVGFAALVTITIVPALLSFAPYRILRPKERAKAENHIATDADRVSRKSFAFKWVHAVTKKPMITILVALIGLGAIAVPAKDLYLGLPSDSSAAIVSTERKAYDLLSEGFGAGFNGPLIAVVDLPEGLSQADTQAKLASIAANTKKIEGVALVSLGGVSPDGRTGILSVIPTTGPDEPETREVISRIRDGAANIAGKDTTISLTGATAIAVDVNTKLADALPIYLAVVIGLSLIILITVFRSIVVPIKATLGFLLTILSTLGLMVMFFQWGWLGIVEAGPILSFLPILATGILFGLAMDYQFFLVSGMQEEFHKNKNAKEAVTTGFSHGAKVVTVAAIIMMSVFSGFIFTDDHIIKSIGFALAIGVFIDAFIVRMTIVPAVMALFGKAAWWFPAWLDKILPNISIEGSTENQLEQQEDINNMRRAALILTFGNEITKIQRIVQLDKKSTGELPPALDNALIATGLETKISAKTLAKLESVTVQTATGYLNELESLGYVAFVSKGDDRVTHAQLSVKGKKTYDKIIRLKLKTMKEFFEPLTDEDVRSLAKVVHKLRVGNQDK